MEEEDVDVSLLKTSINDKLYPECKCNCDITSELLNEDSEVSDRKQYILSIVSRTENYLRERRIPELIRFLFTKVIVHAPDKPVIFLEKLLDDCMLFRAGHGLPPVLYEKSHLEAILKSFDLGQRGWLNPGQVRRLYSTLGLNYEDFIEERVSCEVILENLQKNQEDELAQLLSAGISLDD